MSDDNNNNNNSTLDNRFEIRKLGPEHIEWASAIIWHSNIFNSPAWAQIYSDHKTERLYKAFKASDYLVRHQIESGYSYGVFDREYQFKNPLSTQGNNEGEGGAGAGAGALYWNEDNKTATSAELLAQMDFPLVSVALALDAVNPVDLKRLGGLVEALPLYIPLTKRLDELDPRDQIKVTSPNQVMLRNGTSTRADYEGFGLMKKTAHFLMRKAAEAGFRAVGIESLHDAIHHVWLRPPAPFRATLIAQTRINEVEEMDEEGKLFVRFPFVTQVASRIRVDLV